MVLFLPGNVFFRLAPWGNVFSRLDGTVQAQKKTFGIANGFLPAWTGFFVAWIALAGRLAVGQEGNRSVCLEPGFFPLRWGIGIP